MELKDLIQSEKLTLVEFTSPGCTLCNMQGSVLSQVSEFYGDTINVKIQEARIGSEIEEKFTIKAAPTNILFKNGESVWRHNDFASLERLKNAINENI